MVARRRAEGFVGGGGDGNRCEDCGAPRLTFWFIIYIYIFVGAKEMYIGLRRRG